MENNIANAYYNRIKDNIIGYTETLVSATFEKKVAKKVYAPVIENYIDDVNRKTIKLTEETEKFLSENNINHFKLNNIINYILTFTGDTRLKLNTYKYADTIFLLSKLILISIDIHTKTNIFINSKISYSNILNEIMNKNLKLFDKDLRKKIKSCEVEIKSKIKKNISDEKKFVATFKNENFYLTYSIIDDTKVEAKINYEIKALNKYLKTDIENQILKKRLDIKFFFVALDLLSLIVIKSIFSKRGFEYFFIELPSDVLNQDLLIEEIESILNNERIKERIIFKIPYKEAMKNKSKLVSFNARKLNIAIYDIETLDEKKDEILLNGLVTFILASKKFIDSNEKLYVDNIKLFVEERNEMNMFIKEDDLLCE